MRLMDHGDWGVRGAKRLVVWSLALVRVSRGRQIRQAHYCASCRWLVDARGGQELAGLGAVMMTDDVMDVLDARSCRCVDYLD